MHACMCVLSCVQLFVTPWAVAHQVPLSKESSRQGYWSRLLFPMPGDLSHPGIKAASFASSALAGRFFTTGPFGKPKSLMERVQRKGKLSLITITLKPLASGEPCSVG